MSQNNLKNMDDEQILQRGGTEEDIVNYAKNNGADLTDDEQWREEFRNLWDSCNLVHGAYQRDICMDFIAVKISQSRKQGEMEGLGKARRIVNDFDIAGSNDECLEEIDQAITDLNL